MPISNDLGLSWKRFDLHVHTPASRCFKGVATPEDLVNEAITKELDAIAITDHNTAEWIDRVKETANAKGLVIFPGVEISCTGGKQGIHIVCIMDPSATSKHVEAILNVLGIGPDSYGREDAISDKSPIEVINVIQEKGGIAILAHANSTHGVLADMSGNGRTNIIQNQFLLAAECTDYADKSKKKKRKRVIDYLDGSDPEYRRKLAVYQASDSPCPDGTGRHCIKGIGTRYSHFKVERINLEGLRQCFVDPDVRIRQIGEEPTIDFPRIKHVKIDSGFLDGQEAEFHSGLTSILGGKGTGKSILMEFIRFALNQESSAESIARDHLGKLRSRLGEFGSVEVTYIDENGKESVVKRVFREIDGSPYDSAVPYDPAQVFPVLFLSQNEIVKIAEDQADQLHFIDQFFDFHSYRAKIATTEKELEQLDKAMGDGLRAYSESADLSSKIATLDKEISRLDEALKDSIFEEFQRLEQKENAFLAQTNYLSEYSASVQRSKEAITSKDIPEIPLNLATDPALLRNRELIVNAQNRVSEILDNLSKEIATAHDSAVAEYKAWHSKYVDGKKKYELHIQQIGGDYKAIALSRERVTKQRDELRKRLDLVTVRKERVPNISNKRNSLLDELQSVYKDYTDERKAKCVKFQEDSDGKLQLRILDQRNADEFESGLLSLKRGSYLRDDEITTITANVKPRDFVISLLRYEATKESKHLEPISKASSIEIQRMKTLADFLLSAIQYEELLSLQYRAHPQDRPEILYDIGNGDFQPLSSISVGQKCTAMLLMALSDGTMPIIIDQPEDSLDIRSVWEDMCSKLRAGKERRQFVFTTHNSSLAVASDTDCYLILESDASQGRIVHVGSLDHDPVATEVMQYLEGGEKTYSLKYDKYGRPLR